MAHQGTQYTAMIATILLQYCSPKSLETKEAGLKPYQPLPSPSYAVVKAVVSWAGATPSDAKAS